MLHRDTGLRRRSTVYGIILGFFSGYLITNRQPGKAIAK